MKKLYRAILIILTIILAVYILYPFILESMASFLIVKSKLKVCDAIVVISGDENVKRVEEGVNLYKKGYGKFILMSGGPALWRITQADNMFEQARSLNVPASAILLERHARSTYENALFSLPILQKKKVKSIILVATPFHMRRSNMVFKEIFSKVGIEIIPHPIPNSDFKVKKWWKRHEETERVVWEFEALIFYYLRGYLR